jgi:hypothetical protein
MKQFKIFLFVALILLCLICFGNSDKINKAKSNFLKSENNKKNEKVENKAQTEEQKRIAMEKAEADQYEIERANAMAELIF